MKTVLRVCQVVIYAAFYSKGKTSYHWTRASPGPSLVPGPDNLLGNLLKGVAVHQQVQLINHYWIKPISWILIVVTIRLMVPKLRVLILQNHSSMILKCKSIFKKSILMKRVYPFCDSNHAK